MSECLSFNSLIVRNCRWSLGAKEILHRNALQAWFFSLGQAMPIVRGDGVYQTSMNYALDELKNGGWVHIFPEGM